MITDLLKTVSKIKVGSSAEYPVISIRTSNSITSPANQTKASYEETRWDFECLAEIASPTSITALNETLRSQLAKVGETVTLTELGSSRILPAAGVGGSLTGYPQVDIVDVPEKSIGQYQAFSLSAVTRVPIVDGEGIVEHTTETETITHSTGSTESSVRGEIRLAADQDAAAWVEANVFAPARTAADGDGKAASTRVTVTDDTSHAKYSYSVKPGVIGTPGITEANVEDRTVKDVNGRRVRTISGNATGPNATAFATAQRVASSQNLKLINEDGPSLPNIPNGRVNFSYQYVAGMTDARFPGIFITQFKDTIRQAGGGQQISASSYLSANPHLRLGEHLPVQYTQSSQIEFIGDSFTSHGLVPNASFDTNRMIGKPRQTRTADGDLKSVSMDWAFLYEVPITVTPTPRTINGLT